MTAHTHSSDDHDDQVNAAKRDRAAGGADAASARRGRGAMTATHVA
jgi:hypothetical protein